MIFVLDASAVLRFLDNDAGADRMRQVLKDAGEGKCRIMISAINWGEVAGKLYKRKGPEVAASVMERLARYNLEIVPVTGERAIRSAIIKERCGIPYADAFGVELASDTRSHLLLTADFDVKPADQEIQIEFLPVKAKP